MSNVKNNSPASMLTSAFGLVKTGETNTIRGTQLGAAAIMLRHDELVLNASKASPVVALVKLAKSDKSEARATYVKDLIAFACVAAPSRKDEVKPGVVISNDTFQARLKEHARQRAATMRSLDLAVELASANVGLDAFDYTANMFKVQGSALLEPGDVVSGKAALAAGKTVALDGAEYGCLRGEAAAKVPATVKQLIRANFMRANDGKAPEKAEKKGASNTTTSGTALAVEVKADTGTWSLQALCKAIGDLAVKAADIMNVDGSDPVTFDMLPTELINAYNELGIVIDTAQANTAKAATPPTTKKAADKKAA